MVAKNYIDEEIPYLKPEMEVFRALDLMEESRNDSLALVVEEKYQGILNEDYLLNLDDNLKLDSAIPDKNKVYLTEDQHLFEMLDLLPNLNQSIIPIVDEENNYLGSAHVSVMLKDFVMSLGRSEQGAVIEISLKNRNYSLAEISSIIEAEKVKIISSYVSGTTASLDADLKLTLKLNSKYIEPIVSSLRRFKYDVVAYYASDPIGSVEQDRYGHLMKYLDI